MRPSSHPVELIVLKRRFRCMDRRKSGRRTRYGMWLAKEDNRARAGRDRKEGRQGQPVAHVAKAAGVTMALLLYQITTL
jgi:hypothetical protein